MSRFQDEVDIIPRPVYAIAIVTWLAFFLLMFLVAFGSHIHDRNWPLIPRLAVSILPGIPLSVLVLLIGYVYADARRRGMRYIMWTLLAIFIPNAIGVILYFVLRDPILVHCTQCGSDVRPGFAFCPRCGSSVTLACPHCRGTVEPGWTHCAHCGASLRAA